MNGNGTTPRGERRRRERAPPPVRGRDDRREGTARDGPVGQVPTLERIAGGSDRGQTVQDFAVGAGVFLLAVAFVFAVVPALVSPYQTDVGAVEASQADRTATAVVGTLSVQGEPNRLETGWNEAIESWSTDDLRSEAGLPPGTGVNVTVENVSSSAVESESGDALEDDRASAVATRIVRTDDEHCDPACRVVARVW